MVRIMDSSERRQAGIAYGCYPLIATCLGIALLLDVITWWSSSAEKMALAQVVGMIILLPLGVASIPAAVMAIVLSVKFGDWYSKEWGLAVLPCLLITFVIVLAAEDQRSEPYHWLQCVQAAYVALAFFFSFRWFTLARKRA